MHQTRETAVHRPAGASRPEDPTTEQLESALELDADTAPSAQIGMPMARLRPPTRVSATQYAVTSIDISGRLGERTLLQTLGWEPGHPVAISLAADTIMVTSRPGSRDTVTRQGHVRLPTSVRRACRLHPGDRLLLAAHPNAGYLVAYTPEAIDQMVLSYHATHQLTGTP